MLKVPVVPQGPPSRRSLVRWLMQTRWRLSRGLTLGGQVCVIDGDGGVLLVRHGYRPGWHFPGGGIEKGEAVVDAALRELTEETGIIARGAPILHGIFNHHLVFPGDHIVVFVLKEFERRRMPPPGYEIAEQRFFPVSALPEGTSDGTLRRIAEIFDHRPISTDW